MSQRDKNDSLSKLLIDKGYYFLFVLYDRKENIKGTVYVFKTFFLVCVYHNAIFIDDICFSMLIFNLKIEY